MHISRCTGERVLFDLQIEFILNVIAALLTLRFSVPHDRRFDALFVSTQVIGAIVDKIKTTQLPKLSARRLLRSSISVGVGPGTFGGDAPSFSLRCLSEYCRYIFSIAIASPHHGLW